MSLKSYLKNMKKSELNDLKGNFAKIRSLCREYGVNQSKFYVILEEIDNKKSKATKTVRSTQKDKVQKSISKSEEKPVEDMTDYERIQYIMKKTGKSFEEVLNELNISGRKAQGLRLAFHRYLAKGGEDYNMRFERKIPNKPDEVVKKVYKELKMKNGLRVVTDFQGLVSQVETDLNKVGLDIDFNCSLEAYVGNVLYEMVEDKESKGKNYMRYKNMIFKPIKPSDLERMLGIRFRDRDFNRIAGILDAQTVRDNYVFDDNGDLTIKYLDKDGELLEHPNIEGTICWDDGESKDIMRKDLENYVSERLLPSFISELEDFEDKINTSKGKRKNKLNARSRLKGKLHETEAASQKISYVFESGKSNILSKLRGKILTRMANKKVTNGEGIPGMSIEIEPSDNKHSMRVSFNGNRSDGVREHFLKTWDSLVRNDPKRRYPNVKDNVNHNREQLRVNYKQRNRLNSNLDNLNNEIKGLESYISGLEEKHDRLRTIQYLGLEGPQFGSFLGLYNHLFLSDSPLSINGTFAEYNQRCFNLMESISSHICDEKGRKPDAFNNMSTQRRNIDDWILLDFVNDSEIKLVKEDGVFMVEYGEEKISLDDYYEIIDLSKSQRGMTNDLSQIGNISDSFAQSIIDRREESFDVVFLDYVSEFDEKKRKSAIKLLNGRISDEAIIAVTTSRRFKQKGHRLDEFAELVNEQGYDVMSNREHSYQDRTTPMYFQMYHIKKKSKK